MCTFWVLTLRPVTSWFNVNNTRETNTEKWTTKRKKYWNWFSPMEFQVSLNVFAVFNRIDEIISRFSAFARESGTRAASCQTRRMQSGWNQKGGNAFDRRESIDRWTNTRFGHHKLQSVHSNVRMFTQNCQRIPANGRPTRPFDRKIARFVGSVWKFY